MSTGTRGHAARRSQSLRSVARRARPTPATTPRQADVHERQARRAGRDFISGRSGLLDGLTPVAAAAFRVADSAGEGLPPRLRSELEAAFGADLGALRIHRDAAAAAAARAEQARAFAAGSHLVFAAGEFAPDRAAGRELIAHETAHALQQGARRSSGGRWRLAAVEGSGGRLLCQPGDQAISDSDAEALFDEFANPLLAGAEAVNVRAGVELARIALARIPSIRGRLAPGTEAAPVDFGAALVSASHSAEFHALHPVGKGFVVDCLKIMGWFERARDILVADSNLQIRISRWSQPFADYLARHGDGLNWAAALARSEFRETWPVFVTRSFRKFVMRPHSPPDGEVTRIALAHAAANEVYNEALRARRPIAQETVVLTWSVLEDIARDHHTLLNTWQQRFGAMTGEMTLMHQRVALLQTVRSEMQPLLEAAESAPRARQYAQAILDEVNELLPFWEVASNAFSELQRSVGAASDLQLAAALSGAPPPLRDSLSAAVQTAFSNGLRPMFEMSADTGELPTAEEYGAAVRRFTASLVEMSPGSTSDGPLLEQLDDAVAAEYERTRPRGGSRTRRVPSRERLHAMLALMFWIDTVRAHAMRYDQNADAATPFFADERAAHRIRMARVIAPLARWMAWGDVLALCVPVLSADYSAAARLWLVSDWEPGASTQIGRLAEDFAENLDHPFPGFPFTARHLVSWFRLDYNRRLARTIDEILLQEDRLPSDGNLRLERLVGLRQSPQEVAEVIADPQAQVAEAGPTLDRPGAAMGLKTPQRFIVRDWELSAHPEDAFDWADTIAGHPKTRIQLQRHLDFPAGPGGAAERAAAASGSAVTGLRAIFPVSFEQGVFAWILPSLVPMIRMLAGLPEQGDADLDAETTWLRSVDPMQMTADEWDRFDRHVRRLLETPLRRLLDALPDRMRRLTSLLRRVQTQRWRMRMQGVIGGTGRGGSHDLTERVVAPGEIAEQMSGFEQSIRPADEMELQMGLLLLCLAPQVESLAERPDDAHYLNQYLYPFLISTLAILDDRERFAAMRRCVTHADDEAGNIVYIERRLSQAREQLQSAKDTLDRAAQEAQGRIGYRGDASDGPQGSITPLSRATPIHANADESQADTWRLGMTADGSGHIDYATGTRYQIARVHRDFSYFKGIGSATPEGLRPGALGPHAPARLQIEGEPRPASGEPRLLFTMLIDGLERPVTEDDWALLDRLNDIFLWRSFTIGMENAAAITEAAMQWMITVVGIVQPEVAYAELAVNLVRMAADGEFDELVSQLYHDPVSLIEEIATQLAGDLLRGERLWRFLLLNGSNPLSALGGLLPRRRPRQSHPPRTRLGRIVAALRDIGQRMASGVEGVKRNTRGPLRSAQASISMRPRLAWLLLRAADFVAFIGDHVPPSARERIISGVVELVTGAVETDSVDGNVVEQMVRVVAEQIDETGGDMEQSVRRLLEGLASFELPAELINLQLATELIMQFFLDRFGPRGRAYGLVMQLFPIPEADSRTGGRFAGFTSLYEWLAAQIAAAWRDTAIDPNRYWRGTFMPLIAGRFDTARDELVGELYDASDFVVDALHRDTSHRFARPSGLPSTEVEPVLLDPAVQAGPVGAVRRSPGWHLPQSAGVPLDAETRQRFEQQFGVSFRHVRLHDGIEGRAATEPLHARALTSGSHIYRHPDAGGSGAAAQRLLGHELAHVVQQLGPLANKPSLGRPGAGLVIDVTAERRADVVADRVAAGSRSGVIAGGPSGIQPSFEAAVSRDILQLLATTGDRAAYTAPAGGTAVPGLDHARRLWAAVHGRLEHVETGASFAAFMNEAATKTAVQSVLRDPVTVTRVESDLPGIANLAQRRLAGAARSSSPSGAPRTELDAGRFVNLLEGYLFAGFGIAMQIATDPAQQNVTGLAITNVDLGQVAIDHALWDLAMRAFSGDSRAIRRDLHQRLQVMGPSRVPQPGLFAIDGFRFSALFVEDYRSLERARGSAVLTALPTATDYTATRAGDNRGLALDTHGALKGRGVGQYKRESHHMSQYLLAQFFANVHDRRFVPPTLRPAVSDGAGSGLEWDGSMVSAIAFGSRRLETTAMDVTSSERGANMPAILLASRTHKRGRLHVEREGQWNADLQETSGTSSQGSAISNAFNAALPRDLRTNDTSPEQAARIRAWYAAPAHAGQGARPYYDAAVATYHWMYARMMPALETALRTEERAYYLGIAAIANPGTTPGSVAADYLLSERDMGNVFTAAKQYHDRTMQSRFGWPTP